MSSKEVLTRTYATLPRFRLVGLLCMFIMQRRSMTTPETQSTLHSLRTVSAPVGCDPSCCVPRTDFNPLLKYSILIFVVCCTTRHISGGHAGVKQSAASTRHMGQPWTPTVTNKICYIRKYTKCVSSEGIQNLLHDNPRHRSSSCM